MSESLDWDTCGRYGHLPAAEASNQVINLQGNVNVRLNFF